MGLLDGNLVRSKLDRLIAQNQISGIQNTRFEYAGGMRDFAANKPVTSGTTFMASSSTKVLTAAAILQLIERRQIRLDDPLTVRHLLAQMSGIPNPLPLKWLHRLSEHERFDENSALQEAMGRNSKLQFQPGERTINKLSDALDAYWLDE